MRVIEAGEEAVSPKDMAEQGRMRTDPTRINYLDDFATMRPVLDRPMEEDDDLVEGSNKSTRNDKANRKEQEDPQQTDPHLLRLSQQTGLSQVEIRRLRVKNLVNHRVVNQTRMGKIQSLYFLTIAGNQDGMVGIGEGKSAEDEDARRQAMMNAIRNMKPVARYEERTIFGECQGKVGASVVQLSARPPGESISRSPCMHTVTLSIYAEALARHA